MTEKTTDSLVTFRHPFALRDVVGIQPPGAYHVETVELSIDGLSFVAYRRISTTIMLPAIGTSSAQRQFVEIDPAELAAAQQRDDGTGDQDSSEAIPLAAGETRFA